MNSSQFSKLSSDLRSLAVEIPLHWGAVQNDRFDSDINMFELDSYESLKNAISNLDEIEKNYFRRRWYMWKCAKCDEYLFAINSGVEANSNPKDQTYDVMFHGSLGFDIKGTVVPRSLRSNVEAVISDPQEMIDFFYTKQSRGVRNCFQNRLFIVHHSFVDPNRELYLRCAWVTKQKFYKQFCANFPEINFRKFNDCEAGVIYLLEREPNVISCVIDGYNNNQPIRI